jgi:DNA polymerase-3 subunit delta'
MARARPAPDSEPAAEADRLEGFLHPRETEELFGHEPAERLLAALLAAGRLPHAWVLAGPEGVGKATLAYRFAAHALTAPAQRDAVGGTLAIAAGSPARRQVAALSHPELLAIRRAADARTKRIPASIAIDEVRKLRAFFGRTAAPGSWRVAIVDRADELNTSSANALLKSLEEPPPRTVLLLVAAQPGRLLATIRSRCRVLHLRPLAAEPLRQAAASAFAGAGREQPAEEDWARLMELAGGSVRRLLALSTSDGLELDRSVQRIVAALPSVDWGLAHGLAEELSAPAAQQRFETFFDLLLDAVAALARAEARHGNNARSGGPGHAGSLADVWETLVRDRADAQELGLDKRALVIESLSRLARAAR